MGPLAEVCGTCGNGPLPTGYHFLQVNQTALQICSTSLHRRQRKPSQELHSQWRAYGHWPDGCAGLGLKSYKSSRIRMPPPLPSGYVGWIPEGGPAHLQKASRSGRRPETPRQNSIPAGKPTLRQATMDLSMIAFYYLLWVGENTVKGSRNSTKETVKLKYEDVSFFKKNIRGQLRCLPRNAPAELIATANGATLMLDNQKNRWKGICVYHKTNNNQ